MKFIHTDAAIFDHCMKVMNDDLRVCYGKVFLDGTEASHFEIGDKEFFLGDQDALDLSINVNGKYYTLSEVMIMAQVELEKILPDLNEEEKNAIEDMEFLKCPKNTGRI